MTELYVTSGVVDECHDADGSPFAPDGTVCRGELELTVSKSGCTQVMRCAAHANAYYDRMAKLEADVQSRYPGYDNPHSSPPAWFNPMDAGERWDEDDPWP